MIVGVINFSGNVGKSLVARHLLAPRLSDATVIPVESINAEASHTGVMIAGKDFDFLEEVFAALDPEAHAVVDVGASNVEVFVEQMRQYQGDVHFDSFVLPTVPDRKQQHDTALTIAALAEMGVEPPRLRLLFNRVLRRQARDLERVFPSLFKYYRETHSFTLRRRAVLFEKELYDKLDDRARIETLAADLTDYRGLMKQTTCQATRYDLMKGFAMVRMAKSLQPELDDAYQALFDPEPDPEDTGRDARARDAKE